MANLRAHARWTRSFAHSVLALVRRPWVRRKARKLSRGEVFVELGSGPRVRAAPWASVDVTPEATLYWDLRAGIPFPDSSVDGLYSAHFFEHLTYREGQACLDECMRVLKPGGFFSICVPDAMHWVEAYLEKRVPGPGDLAYGPANNHTTAIDWLNYVAYMDGHHKYLFDADNLLHLLSAKGFVDVRQRSFDASIDEAHREADSLFAIATKPV